MAVVPLATVNWMLSEAADALVEGVEALGVTSPVGVALAGAAVGVVALAEGVAAVLAAVAAVVAAAAGVATAVLAAMLPLCALCGFGLLGLAHATTNSPIVRLSTRPSVARSPRGLCISDLCLYAGFREDGSREDVSHKDAAR